MRVALCSRGYARERWRERGRKRWGDCYYYYYSATTRARTACACEALWTRAGDGCAVVGVGTEVEVSCCTWPRPSCRPVRHGACPASGHEYVHMYIEKYDIAIHSSPTRALDSRARDRVWQACLLPSKGAGITCTLLDLGRAGQLGRRIHDSSITAASEHVAPHCTVPQWPGRRHGRLARAIVPELTRSRAPESHTRPARPTSHARHP